jgi:hypothetical protein
VGVDEGEVKTVDEPSDEVEVCCYHQSTQFAAGTRTPAKSNHQKIISFLASKDLYADEWVKSFKNSTFGNPKLHLKWGDIITFHQLLFIADLQVGLPAVSMGNVEKNEGIDR